MNDYDVIIKPLVTEQGMHFANVGNAYSFQVHTKANKIQIKSAIEHLYKVKVKKVRTSNRKGKPKRRGMHFGNTPHWKKAVVLLDEEYHIDMF